jgi:hypothetical protein
MSNINFPLSIKALRELETELGVYLADPINVARCPNQQFGVYDENEVHIGDIVARNRFFTFEEIPEKVKILFNR